MKYVTIAAVILVASFFLNLTSSLDKTGTFDENIYTTIALQHYKTGQIIYNAEHPPLSKYLIGFPLNFLNLNVPEEIYTSASRPLEFAESMKVAQKFMFEMGNNADEILFWARIPIMLVFLVGGIYVFRWSKELFGDKVALVTTFLYSFNPTLIANAGLATTDMTAMVFMFISGYYFWKYVKAPSKSSFVKVGVTFGLALLSKHTALYLIPIFALVLFWQKLSLKDTEVKEKVKQFIVPLFLIIILGTFVLNAGYLFQGTLSPISSYKYYGPQLMQKISVISNDNNMAALSFLTSIPMPLPESYVKGMIFDILFSQKDYRSYLNGQIFYGRNILYFPTAVLLKTPMPVLLLTFLGLVLLIKKHDISDPKLPIRENPKGFHCKIDEYYLLIPAIFILFLFSFVTKFNVGVRHIIPIFPFLLVFCGKGIEFLMRSNKKLIILSLLLIWYAFSAISVYPYYIAYFNELAGGPDNGYKFLIDSNLDWGQDLKGLKSYMVENNINKIKLSYFGTADPKYYNISFERMIDTTQFNLTENLTCEPTKGVVAISATNLFGMGRMEPNCFDWIKKYEPVEKIGYSIFVYNISKQEQ